MPSRTNAGKMRSGHRLHQTVVLTGFYSRQNFDRPLRRIKFNAAETGKTLIFLTNNFALPAMTIAELYKYRWQVELFFKWIKQHLRIKAFFGTSENAVKAQIWSARAIQRILPLTAAMASARSSRKFSRASGTDMPRERMRYRTRFRMAASARAPKRTRQRSSLNDTSRT